MNKKMNASRREFLRKAGKVAIYAPPAMAALANPTLESIARSGVAACYNDCLPPGIRMKSVHLDNDDLYGKPGNPQMKKKLIGRSAKTRRAYAKKRRATAGKRGRS
jgi:hypothetical protein